MTNKDNDGITSQKILKDNCETFSMLLVSVYNHINAITLTKGTEARTPPQNELRLEISEIAVMIIAETTILIMYCHIFISDYLFKNISNKNCWQVWVKNKKGCRSNPLFVCKFCPPI